MTGDLYNESVFPPSQGETTMTKHQCTGTRTARAATALLLLGLSTPTLRAQATTGAVLGSVTDASGRPLAAEIIAEGPELTRSLTVRADEGGRFRYAMLPVGRYTITVRHVGHRAVQFDSVGVRLGQTTTLPPVVLEAANVTLAPVVVSGERARIDPTTPAIGMVLSAATIRALPMERDVSSILSMIPQLSASPYGDGINAAGSTGYENAHFVDGVHVTEPRVGNGGAAIPYNFVREIEVKLGGYEAEYGRSQGAIINVLTQSGGSRFGGEAFGFFTNNRLDGERRAGVLERSVADYSYYDFGVAFGGPIGRDAARYFLAYNPNFSVENVRVPSFAPQRDERRQDLFAGKLTWQPAAPTTLTLAVHGDPATHDRVAPALKILRSPDSLTSLDPVLGRLRTGGTSVALIAAHALTNAIVLQGTVQRATWRNRNVAARSTGVLVTRAGTWSGGYGTTINESASRTFAGVSALLDRGGHAMKVGIGIEENRLDQLFAYGYPAGTGGYDFGGFLANGGTDGQVSTRVVSIFAQDGWSVSDGLRVNLGVRWDGQYSLDSTGRIAQRLTDGWQPRLGVVWDPSRSGRAKVHASFARFYEQLGTALASDQYGGRRDVWTVPGGGGTVDTVNLAIGQPHVADAGLRGQSFDEGIVGYEQLTQTGLRVGARLITRRLRYAIEDALVRDMPGTTPDSVVVGNPGFGRLAYLPRARRDYSALELTVDRLGRGWLEYAASYVLSRTYGNYTGVYSSDFDVDAAANFGPQFEDTLLVHNDTGLLPNDRTHVLKVFGAWRPRPSFSLGATAVWQSGTPISETTQFGLAFHFLSRRGSLGRTPSLLDLNLRATWEPARAGASSLRIVLDAFHVASRRTPILVDQVRIDEGGSSNPSFGTPRLYQSPMTVRLGFSLGR